MSKTYAGARLRRLREDRGLSQAALARLLSVSPSYLNQMEHDSRPLTVSVLLRLAEEFGVEPGFFSERDTARLVADLREALAEESGPRVSPAELMELATRQPELAQALVDLGRRNRELAERLAIAVDGRDGEGPGPFPGRTPHEAVREFFYRRQNYLPEVDTAAEQLAGQIGIRRGEVHRVLADRLADRHGIRLAEDGAQLHRYAPDERVLYLSPQLRAGQQSFRMATQLAFMEFGEQLTAAAAQDFPVGGPDWTLARIGVANYFAAALILPYEVFHARAEALRYDVERLADEFSMGYETVCHRLSTLQRPRMRGVPFSFVRVDRAGNMSKRQSATGFHFSRAGGTCPLWNVYEAFASPGRVHVQVAAMPDGQRYLWTARTVVRRRGGYGSPGKIFAIGLGCEIRHASRLVYAQGLDLADESAAMPIGMGCRICERPDCPQRAVPGLEGTLDIDQNVTTFVPYPLLGR